MYYLTVFKQSGNVWRHVVYKILCCHLNSFCVVFRAEMWVSASYFVSALLNARCSSSFCKTFHVSFNLYNTWLGVYQWSADLQIPSPRNSASVGFVDKWSVLMICTTLAHAARACSCMVCFSAGHILPELCKFICAMKLWCADRSRLQKKTADPSPRS